MGDPAYGGHALCKSKLNFYSMAPKEPYRQSKWADVSLLLKYISGASPKGLEGPAVLGELNLKTNNLSYNTRVSSNTSSSNRYKTYFIYLVCTLEEAQTAIMFLTL